MSLKEEKTQKREKEKKPKKKKTGNFLYDFVKITGTIPMLFYIRPKVVYVGEGKKPKAKGALICANHNGYTDPVLIMLSFWGRRIRFLATKDLCKTKTKQFFFKKMHCIVIDKKNFSMDSIHAACDELKAGKTVAIFPEGTVNRGDVEELIEFKSGAPLMAYLAGANVIPMYLAPKKKWYQRRIAYVGDPIAIRDICSSPSMKGIENASNVIRENIEGLRQKYIKSKEKKHDKGKRERVQEVHG